MLKRFFALFLSLALLVSAVPVQVFADGTDGGDIILGENELPPIPIDPTDPEETEPGVTLPDVTLPEEPDPTLGTWDSPDALTMGQHTVHREPDEPAYHYLWTASEDGTVTFTLEGEKWSFYKYDEFADFYAVNGDSNVITVEVAAGTEYRFAVGVCDPNVDDWLPGGTVSFTASFEAESAEPDDNIIASGTCGENATWTLTSDGTLTISGTGAVSETGFLDVYYDDYHSDVTSVVVEPGITEICDYGLTALFNLTDISLPNTLTYLGVCAFGECQKLESVTLPASLVGVGGNPFFSMYDQSLKEILVEEGNPYFRSVDGVLYMTDIVGDSLLIAYPGAKTGESYTVPENTDVFGFAFASNKYLKEIILSDGVARLYQGALLGTKIETITIPDGFEGILDNAFASCNNLKEVYFEGNAPAHFIAEAAFAGVEATCYYPAGNETWTEDMFQNYGGTLTWVPYGEEPKECEHPGLVHVEAVAPTCNANGNIEHWYCEVCETVWQDKALTQITNHKNVILPMDENAHVWGEWVTEKEPTCIADGRKVRECEICGGQETEDVAMLDHEDADKDDICDECGKEIPGTLRNPESLPLNEKRHISIDANSSYYYQLTVPEDGILTMNVGVFRVLMRAHSDGLDPDQHDPADKSYVTLQSPSNDTVIWEVVKGETIIIEFFAVEFYGDGTIEASFEAKEHSQGSNANPIVIVDQNKETISAAEFSVTIPAGQKYWFDISDVKNSYMKADAVDGIRYTTYDREWTADEDGVVSVLIENVSGSLEIENTTASDITLALNFEYELGYHKNPMALELGTTEVHWAVPYNYGRYYTWTAPADGTFTFQIAGEFQYNLWQYRISSETEAGQLHTAEDVPCVDTESWEVKAGDRLMIHVISYGYAPDLVVGFAGAFQLTASFEPDVVLPGSTPEDPILVEFTFDEDYTIGTASITLEPGTWYFNAYGIGGMDLTVDGQSMEFAAGAGPMMPSTFTLTNESSKAVTYKLAVTYPVGSMSNPAALVMGENLAKIEAGNNQGWFFNWTAGAKGKLIITMPQGDWTYVINNMGNPDDWSDDVYGDTQWSDSDSVVNPAVVEVSAGDQVQIMVNTYDPANQWSNPAGTIAVRASFEAEHIVPLTLVPMIGEPAQVVEQEDGSYIVFFDKDDVAEEGILFSVMAYAMDENGELLELGVKDLKWSTSDSRVATVKSDKYMPIGNVTVKAETDGACVITAVNSKTKDEAVVTIHVRDYAPRLGATSLTVNSYATAGAETTLLESYGNAIVGFPSLHEYDSKSKTYNEEDPSAAFYPEYTDGKLIINNCGDLKSGTHKLLLKVPCANGKTYEYKISVKVSPKLPSVTVKQLDKFNTFYTDSTTQFQITAKDAAVVNAFFENDSFQSEFDPETGILTVYYSEAYLEEGGKPVTKGDVLVGCDGYWIAVEKAITIKTEKKAPKLALSEKSTVVNTALSEAPVTAFLAYYTETEEIIAGESIRAEANFATSQITEDGVVIMTLTGAKGGTVNVYVQEKNWTEAVKLTHKITVQTKLPVLKLESSTVKLNTVFTDQIAVQYLYLDQRNMIISDLWLEAVSKKESVLEEMDKFLVEVYTDGVILGLDPDNLPKTGTYEIRVTAFAYNSADPENPVELKPKTFKVTVENKVPTVKLKSSTLKLNKNLTQAGYHAYAETTVTLPKGYEDYTIVDMVPAKENENFRVKFDGETGTLRAELLNSEAESATLDLHPVVKHLPTGQEVTLEKTVALKLSVSATKPSISVKSSGKLDTIDPNSAITYTISKLTNIAGVPEDAWLEGEGAELFDVELTEDGSAAVVSLRDDVTYEKGKSYKLQLVFDIFGQEVSAKVTVKVNQSSLKFASVKALNLYQSNARLGCVLTVTAPEGARIQDITLGSKTAKQFLNALGGEDALTFVELDDGTVVVSFRIQNPGYLTYGKSYTVYLDITPEGNASNVKPTQLKLTVKTFK